MKKKLLMIVTMSFILLALGHANALDSASDNMVVTANILQSEISISVPDQVTFQDITAGYLSERIDLSIANTGTVDVSITPELGELYVDDIFQYLSFQQVLSDPLTKIRYFDFEIEKPSSVGGTRNQNIYMYLDLEEYSEEISADMPDHEAEVIFWAIPV